MIQVCDDIYIMTQLEERSGLEARGIVGVELPLCGSGVDRPFAAAETGRCLSINKTFLRRALRRVLTIVRTV